MSADKGTSGDGQQSIETGGADLYGPVRRVERAVLKACEAAALDPEDGGAAALAVELGRAVDIASRRPDPYGVATAGRELRECLSRLRLDPTAREGENDGGDLASWLDALGTPSTG